MKSLGLRLAPWVVLLLVTVLAMGQASHLPGKPRDLYLVMAYDNSVKSSSSSSLVNGQWVNTDLNGDRNGAPIGEWMIRLKLNAYSTEEQKHRDAIGPERFRQAVEQRKQFVWGFTDAVHKIFPECARRTGRSND